MYLVAVAGLGAAVPGPHFLAPRLKIGHEPLGRRAEAIGRPSVHFAIGRPCPFSGYGMPWFNVTVLNTPAMFVRAKPS
jgi:hypothetical protein